MSRYRPPVFWTDERKTIVKRLFGQGLPDKDIAAKLSCTEGAVADQRYMLGLHRKRQFYRLTDEQKGGIRELCLDGFGEKRISQALGIPISPVQYYLKMIRDTDPEGSDPGGFRDRAFVATLLCHGGMPRFREDDCGRLIPGWCDDSGKPWAGLAKIGRAA